MQLKELLVYVLGHTMYEDIILYHQVKGIVTKQLKKELFSFFKVKQLLDEQL